VSKEMNAVDSENKKNLQSDFRRIWQLLQNFTDKDSKMNKFSTGNLETLSHPTIRDDLLKFHKTYYSANIMQLVLYSNKSLDELEKIAREKFAPVVDKSIDEPDFSEPFPFSPK
jgi:insulysin